MVIMAMPIIRSWGNLLPLVIHECYKESRGRGRKERLRKWVTDEVAVTVKEFSHMRSSEEIELR